MGVRGGRRCSQQVNYGASFSSSGEAAGGEEGGPQQFVKCALNLMHSRRRQLMKVIGK